MTPEQKQAFVDELAALCLKHKVHLDCGCDQALTFWPAGPEPHFEIYDGNVGWTMRPTVKT